MANENKKRIYCFDLLKILAILVVISHHMMMDMYIIHPMHNLKFVETILVGLNTNIGLMSISMFMLISGATLSLNGREEEPITFYKKRLIRLLIPFYIAYIINFIIRAINAHSIHLFGGAAKWKIVFTLIGMDEYLNANGIKTFSLGVGEWFLGAIIICYLIYPFLYRAHKKHKYIVFIFMTLFNIFMNVFYGVFNFYIPSHMNVLCQIYNFYLGIFLIDKGLLSKVNKKVLCLTIPVIFILFAFRLPIPDNIKSTIAVAMVFLTFYVFESFISSIKPLTKFIIFFNKISLEIYLVHHFIIYQVDYMLGYKQIGGLKTLCIICFDFVLIVLLAMFVELLTRKVTSLMYNRKNK